jgi:hypothetical protein
MNFLSVDQESLFIDFLSDGKQRNRDPTKWLIFILIISSEYPKLDSRWIWTGRRTNYHHVSISILIIQGKNISLYSLL